MAAVLELWLLMAAQPFSATELSSISNQCESVYMAENDQNVTINGKQYALSSLSDTAKSQLVNLQFVDRQIDEAKNQMAIYQAARQFYISVLTKELPESNS
jgi:hypothetical protein